MPAASSPTPTPHCARPIPQGLRDIRPGALKSETTLQTIELKGALSAEGFLLLDSSMSPILVNHAAAQILAYPHKLEAQKNVDGYLANKVRSTLLSESASGGTLVSRFQSGRRIYSCRSFPVNSMANGHSQASLAVLLERAVSKSTPVSKLFDGFNLTVREQEVSQYLLEGLTSKQIARRMEISPNTVKAFLRLIMVKMGVSTRSGIVGKAFAAQPESLASRR
jgi:DNA-binding CsgD family transcriptional regulator